MHSDQEPWGNACHFSLSWTGCWDAWGCRLPITSLKISFPLWLLWVVLSKWKVRLHSMVGCNVVLKDWHAGLKSPPKMPVSEVFPTYWTKDQNSVELSTVANVLKWRLTGTEAASSQLLFHAQYTPSSTRNPDCSLWMQEHLDLGLCKFPSRINKHSLNNAPRDHGSVQDSTKTSVDSWGYEAYFL